MRGSSPAPKTYEVYRPVARATGLYRVETVVGCTLVHPDSYRDQPPRLNKYRRVVRKWIRQLADCKSGA